MNTVVARIAAVAASIIVAGLAARGVRGITPELAQMLERWLELTLELLLLIGYTLLRAWLMRRIPTPAAPAPVVATTEPGTVPEVR